MAGQARRATRAHRMFALRLERLETRALLDGAPLSGALSSPIAPATSLLVGFHAGATTAAAQAALGAVGGWVSESLPDGTDVVEIPAGVDPSAALGRLDADPAVAYAERDGTVQAASLTPNDPDYPLQWGLGGGGVNIDAPAAWSISTGNSSVIVAVLDTGIDLGNPDLTGRLWTNPTAGSDGYNGDVHGWNFVNNNGNLQDVNGHGSHVTGILAAQGNNGYGIAGVDWNARIMPLKILAPDGSGSIGAAVSAIDFAVNHGARVINASWGGNQPSAAMQSAISYANSKGVVFVTAAGNDGLSNDANAANYPADYREPNELVVAAVDASGHLASFSNFGAQTVDVAAPGVDIFSTIPGGYATYSGTSMATPYVSGVVALLAGQHPEFSAADLVQRVIATVRPLPGLAGNTVSGGIVDAYNALTDTPSPQAQTLAASASSGAGGVSHAPTFMAERPLVIGTGRQKKIIGFQLIFSAALDVGVAQDVRHYVVTQPGRRRNSARKVIPVRAAILDPSWTSVTLVVGKHDAKSPLSMMATGLVGADGTPVASIVTRL